MQKGRDEVFEVVVLGAGRSVASTGRRIRNDRSDVPAWVLLGYVSCCFTPVVHVGTFHQAPGPRISLLSSPRNKDDPLGLARRCGQEMRRCEIEPSLTTIPLFLRFLAIVPSLHLCF